ncbi:MAG: hypothetical protein ACTSX4_03105, partial [Candidatus Helarchaeota archaeon]
VPWTLLAIGIFLFVLGVAGDNPEAIEITKYLPLWLIHYGTPVFVIVGVSFLSIGMYFLYGRIED